MQRCPECLDRLVLPLTAGDPNSIVLNPATTELICAHGHEVMLENRMSRLSGNLTPQSNRSSAACNDRHATFDALGRVWTAHRLLRDYSGPDAACVWPTEGGRSLNRLSRDVQHLGDDADKAEDISVRYGDGHDRPMNAGGPTIAEYVKPATRALRASSIKSPQFTGYRVTKYEPRSARIATSASTS